MVVQKKSTYLEPQDDRVFPRVRLRREEPEVDVGIVYGIDCDETGVTDQVWAEPQARPHGRTLPGCVELTRLQQGGQKGWLSHLFGLEVGLGREHVEVVLDRLQQRGKTIKHYGHNLTWQCCWYWYAAIWQKIEFQPKLEEILEQKNLSCCE